MRAVLPPSIAIPLHSHPDPEVFYILDGALEFLQYDEESSRWLIARTDDTVCIPGDVKHALRNPSLTSVTLLLITTPSIYNFFYELGKPFHPGQPTGPPVPEDMQHLLRLAAKYNYWIASPKENEAIARILFASPVPQNARARLLGRQPPAIAIGANVGRGIARTGSALAPGAGSALAQPAGDDDALSQSAGP